jgi:hypothetical protein
MFDKLKEHISYQKRLKIKYKLRHFKSLFYFNNLTKIATIHKTDKFGNHFYTPHYQNHFKHLKYKKINLLEIGVGGYESPLTGGNSLRMWKSYFPFAKIFSLDIYDKSFLQEKRIKIFKGSQVDKDFLNDVCNYIGEIDLIIDDGSHINEHVITTFKLLFPKLKKGGIYVVEDTQTSYWENYGGDSNDLNKENTIYHFFKSLIDALNSAEFVKENYQKSYYDKNIISMHFYHNMIFIYKGDNNEPSNYIKNNKLPNG